MEIIKPGTKIDFLGQRKLFAGISVGLILLTVVLLLTVGPNYGVDFRGGTNIVVHFDEHVEAADLEEAIKALGYDDAVVQTFGYEDEYRYLVQTNNISTMGEEQVSAMHLALETAFGTDLSFNFNEDSGDRIEIALARDAFDRQGDVEEGTGEVAPAPTEEGQEEDVTESVREARVAQVLADAGLQNARVSQVGNPRDNRFLIRLQEIKRNVESGLIAAFGENMFPVVCADEVPSEDGECANSRIQVVERIESVGPRVGEQLRNDGVKAVVFALFLILVYIGLRFNMRFGSGAVVALFHDVIITMGILIVLQEEITLTILAAFLTIVGYSLNDTIVVFDRIRENLGTLRNKELPAVVNQSLNECLSRTLLTSVTTLLAVVAIFIFGGGLIKSFALTMIIGVLIGTYSSIYVASPVMIWLHDTLEKRADRIRAEERRSSSTTSRGRA